jgi:hypothetical protein
MKKTAAILVFLTVIMLLLAYGGDKARAYECKYFSMTLAAGWNAGPLTFGQVSVLSKGKNSPSLYLKFDGDGKAVGTAEGSIGITIKNFRGSPMEDTTIAGIGFKTTTYKNYNGMTQTMNVAYRNGTKITITIEGMNAKGNADIKAMLGTVAFK